MIPWIIAGAIGAIIADEVISDKVLDDGKDIPIEHDKQESYNGADIGLTPEEIAMLERGGRRR